LSFQKLLPGETTNTRIINIILYARYAFGKKIIILYY